MRGKWSLGKFSLSEGNTLYDNLTILIENGGDLERYYIYRELSWTYSNTYL